MQTQQTYKTYALFTWGGQNDENQIVDWPVPFYNMILYNAQQWQCNI